MEISGSMKFLYHCGAKFIGDPLLCMERFYRTKNGFHGKSRRVHAADQRIFFRGPLDIHSRIIDKSFPDQIRQHVGTGAVGIQLHRIVQSFDLLEKIGQIRIQSRLAAGNTYALQNRTAFFQKIQYFFTGKSFQSRVLCQLAVLAEGAVEIAA